MKNIRFALLLALGLACAAPEPEGLAPSQPGTGAQVKFDVFGKPLPEIPLPNDFATRFDPGSPTGRRVNASMVAPTTWEKTVRKTLDALDGWSTFAPITVSFDSPLDPEVIYQRHRANSDFGDDAVYVIDISPDSPTFCQPVRLDMGEGNFPYTLERQEYYPNDPREKTNNMLFEEVEEDLNHNGILDPGEDTDMDGVLDHPNSRTPGGKFPGDLLAFYERETNTLLMRPLLPLREETTYAAVLTRRLLDASGRPVRSPFKYINHTQQTAQLAPLPGCLKKLSLPLEEVAFTWSFTTQTITRDIRAVRDGLYGTGSLSWLADKFPAEITDLPNARDDEKKAPGVNLKIVKTEQFLQLADSLIPLISGMASKKVVDQLLESFKYIDFHVVGTFTSPQFFPRKDDGGQMLPLGEQLWRVDPLKGEAYTRPEKIAFWITVPKKEYAKRPAPTVLLGHGYGGSKLELPLMTAGLMARNGMATMSFEHVSHGPPVGGTMVELIKGAASGAHIGPMFGTLLQGRAFDQNGDGQPDSGADFFTAFVFHSRDEIRQSVVDIMQATRLLRSFDGHRRWKFDVDNNGEPELAGDFDADGTVDIGGTGPIRYMGASLGAIVGMVAAGSEPAFDSLATISGGGGLFDVSSRTVQGGVVEAVHLRMVGPLLITLPNDQGKLDLWEYLPDLNNDAKLKLGPIDGTLAERDTAILKNLKTGEHRCARVQAGGLLRVAVPSDGPRPGYLPGSDSELVDQLELTVWDGPLAPQERSGCVYPTSGTPKVKVTRQSAEVKYQQIVYPAGGPLIAFGDGFALRRGTPELRRFLGIAQQALDPGDPINYTPFYEQRSLRYDSGEKVGPRALMIVTLGDMGVPASTGVAAARAAGFVDFTNPDPRWGKTPNQVLIDSGALEAAVRIPRHINSSGQSVLEDVDYLADITTGVDGFDVPRLTPPLRLVKPSERLGGYSGVLFPMITPTGRHFIDVPNPDKPFDVSTLVLNIIAHFSSTAGVDLNLDRCNVDTSCPWFPPPPPPANQ